MHNRDASDVNLIRGYNMSTLARLVPAEIREEIQARVDSLGEDNNVSSLVARDIPMGHVASTHGTRSGKVEIKISRRNHKKLRVHKIKQNAKSVLCQLARKSFNAQDKVITHNPNTY